MSVGIYVPTFNVVKYVRESFESIFKQTYKDFEIVIIDDNSTDGTFNLLNRIFKSVTHHQWTHLEKREEHCGRIVQLKNECISKFERQHDYICHVGSDDLIPKNCLEIFVKYMDAHPEIGACCGNFECFDDSGNKWSFPHVANSGEYDSNILLRYMCLFPMRFYRRSVVESVGGYSNELTSAVDYDLALKLDEVTKIHRIKDPITYYYRQHSQQVSTRARPEQDLNAKMALENALKRRGLDAVVKNNAPPFIIEHIEKEKSNHFIWGVK